MAARVVAPTMIGSMPMPMARPVSRPARLRLLEEERAVRVQAGDALGLALDDAERGERGGGHRGGRPTENTKPGAE